LDHTITDTQLACIQLAADEIHAGSLAAGIASGLSSTVGATGLRESSWVAADDADLARALRSLAHLREIVRRVRLDNNRDHE
jgi:hypothetical protein